jgi:hypothetical protein
MLAAGWMVTKNESLERKSRHDIIDKRVFSSSIFSRAGFIHLSPAIKKVILSDVVYLSLSSSRPVV